jgi:3-oxoacyl-[acyl-carrier protein] reductase
LKCNPTYNSLFKKTIGPYLRFGFTGIFSINQLLIISFEVKMMEQMVAVVTGGTRGIGLGIAKTLVKQGASVAVTYKEDDAAARKAKEQMENLLDENREVLLLKGDAGDAEAVKEHHREIHDKLGSVNVLVNNAGIMFKKSFEELSISDWDNTVRINLSSAFYWSAQVIPGMKNQGYGRIVNIASVAARGPSVLGPHYAASKAGLLGLTKFAARDLGSFGITVNAIAPAFIEDAGIFAEWSDEQRASPKDKVLVPQIGNVEDVVRAFEYLLYSPFVTGVTLDVNGGVFMI